MEECCICRNSFDTDSLLENSIDEHFCKGCFKQHYMAAAQMEPNKTKKCNKYGRGDDCSTAFGESVKMISPKDMAKIKKARQANQTAEISKRPIQCPMPDCSRYVSMLDLTSHFLHEHHEVAIIQTALETRNPIIFQRKEDLFHGEKQCIAIFDVSETPQESVSQDEAGAVTKPDVSVALMMARVYAGEEYGNAQSSTDYVSDKLILWMASNTVVNYSYTIAVSNVDNDVRLKYYGPMLQIGAETPSKLCRTGQGLVVTKRHFSLLTARGGQPVHIHVIVHKDV